MQQAPVRNVEAVVIDVSVIERTIAFRSAVVGLEFGASFEPAFGRAHRLR